MPSWPCTHPTSSLIWLWQRTGSICTLLNLSLGKLLRLITASVLRLVAALAALTILLITMTFHNPWDEVAEVDIAALLAFHRKERCQGAVTAVQPPRPAGYSNATFRKKLRDDGDWISRGFFVLSPIALDHIVSDETLWEDQPVRHLAASGQLAAFRHCGFWQPMDTLRAKSQLEELWSTGSAPWKLWT